MALDINHSVNQPALIFRDDATGGEGAACHY
jgi:hypothetical protein